MTASKLVELTRGRSRCRLIQTRHPLRHIDLLDECQPLKGEANRL
jgi:hypothetical protein